MVHLWARFRWTLQLSGKGKPGLFSTVFESPTYVTAMVAVVAKLAKADGPVNRIEIDAFKQHFHLHSNVRHVARLFDRARETSEGFQPFVLQLREILGSGRPELRDLFESLYAVAVADGPLHPAERAYLRRVAAIMGWGPGMEAILAQAPWAGPDNAYVLLGVAPDTSDEELQKAWRRLAHRFHPDREAARGVPSPDHARMAAINAAYGRIMAQRRAHRQAHH